MYTALVGARAREEREWERTLYTIQAIINYGGTRGRGFKPKPLDDLYRKAFGRTRPVREMTGDQIRAAFAAVAIPESHARD